uniref:Uncharacterized protein n=1 Tax=Physcomitrium patens TaxID=3218 RepID=A0A2K1L2P8_PHYPA|nr:hypothetical protein PHYPA_003084 [Physcomitrium patens]
MMELNRLRGKLHHCRMRHTLRTTRNKAGISRNGQQRHGLMQSRVDIAVAPSATCIICDQSAVQEMASALSVGM